MTAIAKSAKHSLQQKNVVTGKNLPYTIPYHGFCIIQNGWGLSHLKPDIKRNILRSVPFLEIFTSGDT